MLEGGRINIKMLIIHFPTFQTEARDISINELSSRVISPLLLELPFKNSEKKFSVITKLPN